MRPLRLELEGFTAFREKTCLDLSQLDLFAVTGPTGAGKSSLIDAICYALYGRVPRVANEVSACISQGVDRMRVSLEFQAGEERYRVYRETRRKGAPSVRLERWDGADWRAEADRVRDASEVVERVVGLDYEAFTRSVLLPQGQFQEFLAGAPDKRRSVLGSLLRLEVYRRMQQRAYAIANEKGARIDGIERELESLAEATPENLKAMSARLTQTKAEVARLQGELAAASRAAAMAEALARARDDVSKRQAELGETRARLDEARRLVADGDDRLAAMQSELAETMRALEASDFDAGLLAALVAGERLAGELEATDGALAGACQALEAARRRSSAAEASAEKLAEKLAQAEAERLSAEEAYREVQRHNMAAVVQQGLQPGDRCPVCGGAVGEMPALEQRDFKAAQVLRESSERALQAAREESKNASVAVAKARAEAEAGESKLKDLESLRTRQAKALEETLPGREPSLASIRVELQSQRQAEADHAALLQREKDLAPRVDALKTLVEEARRSLAAHEQAAVASESALTAAASAANETSEKLRLLAAERCWTEVVGVLESGRDPRRCVQALADESRDRHEAASRETGQLEAKIDRLEQDIERARALEDERKALRKEHGLAADLEAMLRAGKFQSFVQARALQVLADDGSRRLETLSAGRYRLTTDERGQDFEVIDQWNADERRSVKTLSGGETFLASLSLALALAESLPGLAASRRVVLDSIFLDEGFGALDAEALDRAADALDALRGENRMVCVVTHLQSLADRLPARVIVSKAGAGSSVDIA